MPFSGLTISCCFFL